MKKNEEMEVHVFANSDIDSEDTICGVFYETRSGMVYIEHTALTVTPLLLLLRRY